MCWCAPYPPSLLRTVHYIWVTCNTLSHTFPSFDAWHCLGKVVCLAPMCHLSNPTTAASPIGFRIVNISLNHPARLDAGKSRPMNAEGVRGMCASTSPPVAREALWMACQWAAFLASSLLQRLPAGLECRVSVSRGGASIGSIRPTQGFMASNGARWPPAHPLSSGSPTLTGTPGWMEGVLL